MIYETQEIARDGVEPARHAERRAPETPHWDRSDPDDEGWASFDLRPRFELARDGRLISANVRARQALADRAVGLTGERLRFGSAASNRRLERALQCSPHRRAQRLVLRRMDGGWRAADLHSLAGRASVLLILGADEEPPADAFNALAEAFELTRGEARILQGLCAGACAKEIATAMGVSEHTVRAHLRAIYGKLGVRGLPNAIRLAARLTT